MLEIRNLKTFLRVAALQNFTKAGQELGYSQSNVSVQISQLEKAVGVPLFDRIGKNVQLTSSGFPRGAGDFRQVGTASGVSG